MTPSELDATLTVLRKHGVVSAEVGTLKVVFGLEGPMPPGQELTPGGWKSPDRLDRDHLDDERSVP